MRKKFVSASKLSKNEVKRVLLTKIKEEQNKIFDEEKDDLLNKVVNKKIKLIWLVYFQVLAD
ncbi:hypothetical protein [Lactobacillus sp. PV037]|uniref:hypothetical protein n=1 Tax=Lactobacillus sp. PV037 TaxID=2594496 RepID=UPI00223F5907|nr:hypothetical protein [Lactobacillus sp. PV037]